MPDKQILGLSVRGANKLDKIAAGICGGGGE